MTYTVRSSRVFVRRARKFFRKHSDLRPEFDRVMKELGQDPFHPSLRLHPPAGKLEGEYAVSLTYAYRIILALAVVEEVIVLIDIGAHDDVYH